jgi:hypothetical protein
LKPVRDTRLFYTVWLILMYIQQNATLHSLPECKSTKYTWDIRYVYRNFKYESPESNAKALPISTTFSKLRCTEMKELVTNFNVYGSVHCKNILIYIKQDETLHGLFYLETALHVSGCTPPIIKSANNCIYSIW